MKFIILAKGKMKKKKKKKDNILETANRRVKRSETCDSGVVATCCNMGYL